MATLIHLNGAPGIGKSTVAQRYVAEHPGVLDCDVDRLRRLVGGWQDDFDGIGAIIRPVALAMIRAHLDGGHDVVLPQMLVSEDQRARFRAAALDAGHDYLHIALQAPVGVAESRFYGRSEHDTLNAVIRRTVDGQGGSDAIGALDRRLAGNAEAVDDVVHVDASGDLEATYRAVVGAVEAARQQRPLR
ncbi:ATP-binding protein [Nocardioides ginsengisoli]|uniref:AAA family ATPase n=1 Tax=Nocardioides ginsengisoli TaxID=363868 RepID=A0ABW3VZT6_9ACTN